jgi:hypothetical protein
MTAPIASGWSESPGGPCTHWKAPPCHGARRNQSFAVSGLYSPGSRRPTFAIPLRRSGELYRWSIVYNTVDAPIRRQKVTLMEIDEFIDTYSDDVLYLDEARAALLTHPLMPTLKELTDASACRLLAVFMIGNIEVMLETWRDRDGMGILSSYFNDKLPNGEKVSALFEAFRQAGIDVNKDIFDDYLAIKYLRNTIIHGRWKDHERIWVESRGFPSDTRKLTDKHLEKIADVDQNMMYYVFLTGHTKRKLAKPYTPKLLTASRHDVTGIIKLKDISRIIWQNLERITSHLSEAIAATVTTREYDWSEGRSRDELENLGHNQLKRLYYLAARRAGEDDYPPLQVHRELAGEALAFWRLYWERAVVAQGFDRVGISQAVEAITSGESWLETSCAEVDHSTLEPSTNAEDAVRLGKFAYDAVPNLTPVTLLAVVLPIIDPANTTTYLSEATNAWNAFILGRAWYSVMEHREVFRIDESLEFYRSWTRELNISSSLKGQPCREG